MILLRPATGLFLAALLAAGCASEPEPDAAAGEGAPVEVAEEGGDVQYPNESLAPARTAPGGSLEERLQDASLAAQVKMRLVQETVLHPYRLEVRAEGGRVTIAGEVASAEVKEQAGAIAQRVQGVREVRNRIDAPGAPATDEGFDENLAEARPQAAERGEAGETAAAEPGQEEPEPEEPAYHTVQSGESLWVIARQYDLSIDELKELNSLRSNGLRPGQRLRVE